MVAEWVIGVGRNGNPVASIMVNGHIVIFGLVLMTVTGILSLARREAPVPPLMAFEDHNRIGNTYNVWTVDFYGENTEQHLASAQPPVLQAWTPTLDLIYTVADVSTQAVIYQSGEMQREGATVERMGSLKIRPDLQSAFSFDLYDFAIAEVNLQDGQIRKYSQPCRCRIVHLEVLDNDTVSVLGYGDGAYGLYRYTHEKSEAVITASEDYFVHSWAPDLHAVVYTGNGLTIQPVDGEAYTIIEDDTRFYKTPMWSPDGEWIVFTLADGESVDIYRVRPDGTDLQQLTHTPAIEERRPVWSPDGQWIAYLASSPSNNAFYRMQADGTDNQRVGNVAFSQTGAIMWSPIIDLDWNPAVGIVISLWSIALCWLAVTMMFRGKQN